MRTINITFELTDRQYEYLCLAKSERPNPQRMKMQLLSQAMSTLRREGEMVMQEARDQNNPSLAQPVKSKLSAEDVRKHAEWVEADRVRAVQMAKPKPRYKSPSQRELDARKAKLVLTKPKPNGKKDGARDHSPSDYSAVKIPPTDLDDLEF